MIPSVQEKEKIESPEMRQKARVAKILSTISTEAGRNQYIRMRSVIKVRIDG